MKLIDDILSAHRNGATITYQDLLSIADGVAVLEQTIERGRQLLREYMLRDTQALPETHLALLAKAFAAWETSYRAAPTEFLTPAECAAQGIAHVSAERAAYFYQLLREVVL